MEVDGQSGRTIAFDPEYTDVKAYAGSGCDPKSEAVGRLIISNADHFGVIVREIDHTEAK